MKHFLTLAVVLLIGYYLGTKYPSLLAGAVASVKGS